MWHIKMGTFTQNKRKEHVVLLEKLCSQEIKNSIKGVQLACPLRTDPVSVLDLRINLYEGESYGQESIFPGTDCWQS